jgi:hypothetical protein
VELDLGILQVVVPHVDYWTGAPQMDVELFHIQGLGHVDLFVAVDGQ